MKIDKKVFFDAFRPWYRKKTGKRALSEVTANAVDFLLDGFMSNSQWKDVRHAAYALSTIFHETAASMLPIKEYRAKAGSRGRANQDRYWLSGYYGRGFVQLTWKYNYEKAAKKLGVDLVDNPSLALRNDIAFKILTHGMIEGWFTGKKLSDYINSKTTDYKNARRIINGVDKAALLAGYAQEFEKMLKDALINNTEPKPTVKKTGSSQPVVSDDESLPDLRDTETNGEGIPQPDVVADDVAGGEAKEGEPAPEDAAQKGEAIVGGRPTDPPIILTAPEEESIKGWRTWPTTITATLGGLGISVGGIFTSLSGIELSPQTQVMIGWIVIIGIVIASLYGLFYLWNRSKGTLDEKSRMHEVKMKELEIASMPDRYNVKSVR